MKRMLPTLALAWLATASTAPAASIGDPAPPFNVERWIKGLPTRLVPGTNIYVIDFWATWCGPCKRSIPHLTELQKKHARNGVIFIGISDETAAVVAPFVAGQGDAMGYRVAVDSSERTFRSWMTAYGETGIPHAFIVGTNGLVLWHDFPGSNLDRALEQILAGTFNIDDAKNFEAGDRLVAQYTAMVSKPNSAARAAPLGEKILAEYSRDWRVPHRLGKAILAEPSVLSRDFNLALRASTQAVGMNRSWDALEMNARALFATGKKQEAVEVQKEALAQNPDPEDRAELEKVLAHYQKSAQQPAPAKK